MPDRELRHMRRTELVEIILALKQSEDQLRAENAALSAQLQERQIHIQNAGSNPHSTQAHTTHVAATGQKTLPCLPSCRNGRSILKTQVPLRRLHWS